MVHIRRNCVLPLLASFLIAAGCSDSLGPGQDGSPDRIVFTSTRAGNLHDSGAPLWDLYAMDVDGTGLERLTPESASALRHLRLSPDGSRVAFYSDVSGCHDVWVVGVDGAGLTQLTGVEEFQRCNSHPEWSPDGSEIAFLTSRNAREGRGWDVYVMGADGSQPRDVTANPSTDLERANDYLSGWSPDGRVVLRSNRDGVQRTYLARTDGSAVEPLFGDGRYLEPRWSPDGSRVLAYLPDGGASTVHLLNAAGTEAVDLTALTDGDASWLWGVDPWSPDGTRVALVGSGGRILVLDVGGVSPEPVSVEAVQGRFLGWSPDGKLLSRIRVGGDEEICLMEADGTGVVNLSNAPASAEAEAVWVSGG